MGKINTLDSKPFIYETFKTVIEKGIIKQKTIIKDTIGNEYKKTNGKLTKINEKFASIPAFTIAYGQQKINQNEIWDSIFPLFIGMFILFLMLTTAIILLVPIRKKTSQEISQ